MKIKQGLDKAWCPCCIVDALTHFATVALTLPEALKSVRKLRAPE